MHEYHEILGSEKPIYRTKPPGLKTISEIPSGEFLIGYEIVGYLEYEENGKKLYEPLYAIVRDES